MNKLLRAGFRRYAKSPALWIAAAVCAVSSVIGGWQARVNYLDDIYICVVWFAAAILVVLFTGMESGEGIFRNKIATGHTKAVVFLSEWLLAAGVWLLFSLIFAMIFIVFNGYLLDVIPQTVFLRVLADFLLGSVGMATLLTAVNCLITHKILNALVSILLVLGMMYGSDYLQGALYEPEYVTVYEYESIKLEDAEGDVWVPLAVEGSEREEKNPGYISGWMRTVCAAVSGLIPYSHVGETVTLVSPHTGYDYWDIYSEEPETYESSGRADFTMTKEENDALNFRLICAAILIAGATSAGCAAFRRKNLR